MNNEIKQALRFNEGKLRYDLIPPSAIKGLAEVLTYGHNKYSEKGGEKNWERGLPWESVGASLMRHLEKWRNGEDYDQESGLLHIDHVLCNAAFVKEFYKTHPELDNRPRPWTKYNKKTALDLDDVVFSWTETFAKKFNISQEVLWWDFSYDVSQQLKELESDKEFWVNLPVKNYPNFVPHCYITARSIPEEWIKESLEKNNLPCRPIYTVPWGASKEEVLKQSGVDILIDDNISNFLTAEKIGITAYLMDTPANRKFDVGARRIKTLDIKEILG